MVFVVVSLIKANRAPDGALFTRKELVRLFIFDHISKAFPR